MDTAGYKPSLKSLSVFCAFPDGITYTWLTFAIIPYLELLRILNTAATGSVQAGDEPGTARWPVGATEVQLPGDLVPAAPK